jgi:hypothetical protein
MGFGFKIKAKGSYERVSMEKRERETPTDKVALT